MFSFLSKKSSTADEGNNESSSGLQVAQSPPWATPTSTSSSTGGEPPWSTASSMTGESWSGAGGGATVEAYGEEVDGVVVKNNNDAIRNTEDDTNATQSNNSNNNDGRSQDSTQLPPEGEEEAFVHDFLAGDHVIRWEMLPIAYPIQIHAIVLEAEETYVTLVDFGLTPIPDQEKESEQDKKDDLLEKFIYKKVNQKKERLNIRVLTTKQELRPWSKVNYNRNLFGLGGSSNEEDPSSSSDAGGGVGASKKWGLGSMSVGSMGNLFGGSKKKAAASTLASEEVDVAGTGETPNSISENGSGDTRESTSSGLVTSQVDDDDDNEKETVADVKSSSTDTIKEDPTQKDPDDPKGNAIEGCEGAEKAKTSAGQEEAQVGAAMPVDSGEVNVSMEVQINGTTVEEENKKEKTADLGIRQDGAAADATAAAPSTNDASSNEHAEESEKDDKSDPSAAVAVSLESASVVAAEGTENPQDGTTEVTNVKEEEKKHQNSERQRGVIEKKEDAGADVAWNRNSHRPQEQAPHEEAKMPSKNPQNVSSDDLVEDGSVAEASSDGDDSYGYVRHSRTSPKRPSVSVQQGRSDGTAHCESDIAEPSKSMKEQVNQSLKQLPSDDTPMKLEIPNDDGSNDEKLLRGWQHSQDQYIIDAYKEAKTTNQKRWLRRQAEFMRESIRENTENGDGPLGFGLFSSSRKDDGGLDSSRQQEEGILNASNRSPSFRFWSRQRAGSQLEVDTENDENDDEWEENNESTSKFMNPAMAKLMRKKKSAAPEKFEKHSNDGSESQESSSNKPKLPKDDPTKLVLSRVKFLLKHGEAVLPQYNPFSSNSETIAVWCKTGKFSTIQADVFLHSTAIGNGKSATAVAIGVAATSGLAAAGVAGIGVAAVIAPWWYLKHSKDKCGDATQSLNDAFWAQAEPEVFVECIEKWSRGIATVGTTPSALVAPSMSHTSNISGGNNGSDSMAASEAMSTGNDTETLPETTSAPTTSSKAMTVAI